MSPVPRKAEVARLITMDIAPALADSAWLLSDGTRLVKTIGDDLIYGIEFDRRSHGVEVLAWLRPQYWPVPPITFGFSRGIGEWSGLRTSFWEPFGIPAKRVRAVAEITACLNDVVGPYFAGIGSSTDILDRAARWPRDPLIRDPAVDSPHILFGYMHAWCGNRLRAELNLRAALLRGGIRPVELAENVRQTLRMLAHPDRLREVLTGYARALRAEMKLDRAPRLSDL
jgi:hypothetical protein